MDKYKNIATILYVEDEDGVRKGFTRALSRYAKKVYEASNGEEGLTMYKQYLPDIVVTDIKMPKMNGIMMSKAIKKINPNQSIIITSAHSESNYLLEAISLQLSGYLLKPVDKKLLKEKVLEVVKYQQMKIELNQSRALMEEITNLQNHLLMVYDESNNIIFANQMFLELFAVNSVSEFLKKYTCMCNVLVEHKSYFACENNEKGYWTDNFEKLSDDKRVVSLVDHRTMEPKAFLVNIEHIDSTKHKICTFTEITTITTKKNEFEKKAFVDELTKIYNRAMFNKVLIKEVTKYKISGNSLSLIIFDIDHFKKFNDTYGHQIGDDILIGLSSIVGTALRDADLFARWGGEEFVILLPSANMSAATAIAETKRKLIEEYVFKNNLRVTCSFGVASMNESDNKESFFKRADIALYKAKESGRNCVVSDFSGV